MNHHCKAERFLKFVMILCHMCLGGAIFRKPLIISARNCLLHCGEFQNYFNMFTIAVKFRNIVCLKSQEQCRWRLGIAFIDLLLIRELVSIVISSIQQLPEPKNWNILHQYFVDPLKTFMSTFLHRVTMPIQFRIINQI